MRIKALVRISTLLFFVPSFIGYCQIFKVPQHKPVVKVVAKGVVETIPDIARVSLGVYVVDPDLPAAKRDADQAIEKLLKVATDLNVEKRDVSSSGISIDPIYSEENERDFVGYEVSRSVSVVLRNLSLLDRLIDLAIQSGANRQFSVSLLSSREKELQTKALNLAIQDAKDQAKTLAEGFGARLGSVYSIYPSDRRSYSSSMVFHSFGEGTFTPGTLKFETELSVTFDLVIDNQ